MRIVAIPCLKDNYAYLVICEITNEAAIVDPSEAEPVLRAVAEAGVTVRAIWNTHHHFDHVGGNEALAAHFKIDAVYGHASDKGRIPAQSRFLDEGDRVTLGTSIEASILHIPGHTTGAIAYVVTAKPDAPRAVFTGDTLFLAGCGRLFEGTPAMMHASLSKLAELPDDTRVHCGHEYTESNLRFAAHVEPGNQAIVAAQKQAADARGKGQPTVPGTMAGEKETNPFLRVGSQEIRRVLGISKDAGDAEALGAIRAAKDVFR